MKILRAGWTSTELHWRQFGINNKTQSRNINTTINSLFVPQAKGVDNGLVLGLGAELPADPNIPVMVNCIMVGGGGGMDHAVVHSYFDARSVLILDSDLFVVVCLAQGLIPEFLRLTSMIWVLKFKKKSPWVRVQASQTQIPAVL